MTKATTNVARVAAAVAGLGLVAMSFAPLASAQTTTTTTTSTTTTSATFTRDLTIGSTGADVTSLQTWLIANGYSIPAGATGYFGTQTKAAVAAFQAANAITPAAGYFGPITRAKVASMGGSTSTGTSTVPGCTAGAAYSSTTGQPCTTSTGTSGLSGGEADLTNYQLNAGDDVSEGDSNTEIASANFDVRGGDINVQRVTVDLQPTVTSGSPNQHPWAYFDTLSVYNGTTKVGSVDVGSKSDWDEENHDSSHDASNLDYYSIDIPVNTVIKEGNNNELSIRADAQSTIDSANDNQVFALQIGDNGIRAIDAAGIQEYIGNDGETVNVGFNTDQNGKLNVTTDSSNPNAGVLVADDQDTSDSYDVLAFDIKNSQDTDVDFNSLTFNVATSSAANANGAKNISTMIRRATLDLDGDTYTGTISNVTSGQQTVEFDNLNTSVSGNSTVTGTLSITLYGQTNHFAASGESLTFSLPTAGVDAESSNTGNTSTVNGSATGKKQSIAVNGGINVAGDSNSTSEAYNSQTSSNSTGSFMLKFDVTANGSDDVYIPKTIGTVSSTTSDTTDGIVVVTDLVGSTTNATTVSGSLSSSADTDPDNSGYYLVRAGDTETFTANVTIDPTAAGYYQIGLTGINFTTDSNGGSLQSLDVDSSDTDFQTNQLFIHN